jgi:glutamine cyclotransferase
MTISALKTRINLITVARNRFSPAPLFVLWKKATKRAALVLLLMSALITLACQTGTVANLSNERNSGKQSIPIYGFEVVHVWPHDPDAFTQGLIFHDGKLLESTGEVGRSSLRRVELETGKV